MFNYQKMENSFPNTLSESGCAWHKEYWSLCMPACKTVNCETNLIRSVHLDNIMAKSSQQKAASKRNFYRNCK